MISLHTNNGAVRHLLTNLYNLPRPDGTPAKFEVAPRLDRPTWSALSNCVETLLAPPRPTEGAIRMARLLVTLWGQCCSQDGTGTFSWLSDLLDQRWAGSGLTDTQAPFNADEETLREIMLMATQGAKPLQIDVDILRKGLDTLLAPYNTDRSVVVDCINALAAEIPVPAPAEPTAWQIQRSDGRVITSCQYTTVGDEAAKHRLWEEYQRLCKEYPDKHYHFIAVYK